jgi:hypothetical protein
MRVSEQLGEPGQRLCRKCALAKPVEASTLRDNDRIGLRNQRIEIPDGVPRRRSIRKAIG